MEKKPAIADSRAGIAPPAIPANSDPSSLAMARCGVVLSCVDGHAEDSLMLRIAVPDRPLPCTAALAASCLLQPEAGDRVLLGETPGFSTGEAPVLWILAVLQRGRQASPAVLRVAGAAELRLQAPSLALLAGQRLLVRADEFELTTLRGRVQAGVMQLVASVADVVAQRMTRLAGTFQAVSQSVSEQCRTRVTTVDEVDSTTAGIVRLESREVMRLKSEQVLIDAKETMRIDGKQILMG